MDTKYLECPFCEDEGFSELRLGEYSVYPKKNGEDFEADFEENYASWYISCRGCGRNLRIIKNKNKFKLIEVTKEEVIEKSFEFMSILLELDLNDKTKEEIMKLIKKEMILENLG